MNENHALRIAILKEQSDDVLRTARTIAQRVKKEENDVTKAIEELEGEGLLVERRSRKEANKGKRVWKITYDGKLYLASETGGAVSQLSGAERLERADKGDIRENSLAQVAIQRDSYAEALANVRKSFLFALTTSIVGFFFLIGAIIFVIYQGETNLAAISLVSGAVIEVLAGVNFYLYGKATSNLDIYNARSHQVHRFMLADSLCENLANEEQKDATRALIAREIANVDSGRDIIDIEAFGKIQDAPSVN